MYQIEASQSGLDIAIDVDVRNYTKYLLREGTLIEKRELLECLQSKLFLKEKKITLE